jgi:hypothetical protein
LHGAIAIGTASISQQSVLKSPVTVDEYCLRIMKDVRRWRQPLDQYWVENWLLRSFAIAPSRSFFADNKIGKVGILKADRIADWIIVCLV